MTNEKQFKEFILKSKNSNSNYFKKPNSLKITNQCFIWRPTCSSQDYYPANCCPMQPYPVHPFRRPQCFIPLRKFTLRN